MAAAKPKPTELELLQFEEACQLLRHYSSLRFRQLTNFAAINGGLLILLYRYNDSQTPYELFASASFGLISAVVFLLLELRLYKYWDFHRETILALEEKYTLKLSLYRDRPRDPFVRGRTAIHIFIGGMALFWFAALGFNM